MTELQAGLVFTDRLQVEHHGQSCVVVDLCLTCAMCLTQKGESFTSSVTLQLESPTRLEFKGVGESGVTLMLLRPVDRPHPDWWHRTSIPDKAGTVHYYRDRSGKLLGIQYKNRYYQP